jgi:hypothetical protein
MAALTAIAGTKRVLILAITRDIEPAARGAGRNRTPQFSDLPSKKPLATISAETVGLLMADPSPRWQIVVVPRTDGTLKLAQRRASHCAAAGNRDRARRTEGDVQDVESTPSSPTSPTI